jgi:hypothetical protein
VRHPFLRTLAGSAATPTDPNFENVTLLLHGDGTNGGQNNTFVDGSTNNFTITRNGNTTQGTFSPYGDNWSNYFQAAGNRISFSSSNINVGTNQFTLEAWIFPISSGGWRAIYAFGPSADDAIYITPGGNLALYRGGVVVQSAATVPINNWSHVAVSRDSSNNVRVFLNGTASGAVNLTYSFNNNSSVISSRLDGNENTVCYISNLRLLIGTALYTSSFTPPTAPLTAITNTRLLTCKSNRFNDNSSNNLTATITGTPSVQRFSPFSPTAAYAAGTIGGSGYFDGTGDYLSRTVTSTTDGMYPQGTTWTIEAWVYPISTTGLILVYSIAATNVAFFGSCWLGLDSGAARCDIRTATGSGTPVVSISGGTVVIRAWNHLAISVSSGSAKLWLNGSQVGSTTSINALTFTPVGAGVGRFGNGYTSGINDYSGYISDVRIIQSTAQYTAAFTPPTAPLTAITNTSLLLNFQNAAILDNAMMAVPETVGNAQIDTTTKKFGTGSLEFDGTGDYLKFPASNTLEMGTGDFTVEFWIYIAARTSFAAIFLSGLGANDLYVNFDTSGNVLRLTNSTTVFAVTGTIPLTTWTHIAVVRSSGSSKIYVDGTGGTAVTCTINFTATGPSIGAANAGQSPFNGYIDDLRVTKGVARYTANFTAPTAAFPDL